MPVSDLLGKRLRTASGAEVAAPTVRSFFRALEVFGAEIGIVREACRKVPGGIAPDIALAPFLVTPQDGRLAYVTDGPPLDLAGAARSWVPFILPLAGRIDALLGEPGGAGGDDSDVDSATLLILGCAERFHIDPMAVMDWPLGLFLDVVQAFSRPPKTQGTEQSAMVGGMGPAAPAVDPLHIPGLVI